MRVPALLVGTISTALLASCSADGMGPRVDKLREAVARSKVSLAQSVLAGEASVSGAKAVKARLLVEANPEYSVDALEKGTLHDVRLDIISGAVRTSRIVGNAADPCPGSVPLVDAIAIAEARVSGTAVQAQPDDDDHCLREIQVLAGPVLWEVKLARDGKVLEVEKSDDDGN